MLGAILIMAIIGLFIFLAGPPLIEMFQDTIEEWKDVLKINKEE